MARRKKDDEQPEAESTEVENTEAATESEPHDPYARTDKDAPQARPRQAPGPFNTEAAE